MQNLNNDVNTMFCEKTILVNLTSQCDYNSISSLKFTCKLFHESINQMYQEEHPHLVKLLKNIDSKLINYTNWEGESEFIISDLDKRYAVKTILCSANLNQSFHALRKKAIDALADIELNTLIKIEEELQPELHNSILNEVVVSAKKRVNGELSLTQSLASYDKCDCTEMVIGQSQQQALTESQNFMPTCYPWKHGKHLTFECSVLTRKFPKNGHIINLTFDLLLGKKDTDNLTFSDFQFDYTVRCSALEKGDKFEASLIDKLNRSISQREFVGCSFETTSRSILLSSKAYQANENYQRSINRTTTPISISTLIFPGWNRETFSANFFNCQYPSFGNILDLIGPDTTPIDLSYLCKKIGLPSSGKFELGFLGLSFPFSASGGYLGFTLMHAAAYVGNLNLIEYFLGQENAEDRSKLINTQSAQGATPLCMAISGKNGYSHPLVVKKLVRLGAKINLGTIDICSITDTPLDRLLAMPREDLSLVQFLIFNGAKISKTPSEENLKRAERAITLIFEQFKCLFLGQSDRDSILCQHHDLNKLLKNTFLLAYEG